MRSALLCLVVGVFLSLPFVAFSKHPIVLPIGLYVAFALFVVVGTSNAVNLTDGLDGLAIVPVMLAAGTFLIISYLIGNLVFATRLEAGAVQIRRVQLVVTVVTCGNHRAASVCDGLDERVGQKAPWLGRREQHARHRGSRHSVFVDARQPQLRQKRVALHPESAWS